MPSVGTGFGPYASVLVIPFIIYTWPALSEVHREEAPTVMATKAARGHSALYVAKSMIPFVGTACRTRRT